MKHRLLEALPEHVDCLQTLHAAHLYIVDWKDENDGGITFEASKYCQKESLYMPL